MINATMNPATKANFTPMLIAKTMARHFLLIYRQKVDNNSDKLKIERGIGERIKVLESGVVNHGLVFACIPDRASEVGLRTMASRKRPARIWIILAKWRMVKTLFTARVKDRSGILPAGFAGEKSEHVRFGACWGTC